MIKNMENYSELRELGDQRRNGIRGIQNFYTANLLDVIKVMWEAYYDLFHKHFTNCWIKSGKLSNKHVDELCKLQNIRFRKHYDKTTRGETRNNELNISTAVTNDANNGGGDETTGGDALLCLVYVLGELAENIEEDEIKK